MWSSGVNLSGNPFCHHDYFPLSHAISYWRKQNSSVCLWSIQYQCVTGKLKSHWSQKCKSARPPKSTESFFFSLCALKCARDNITSFVSEKLFSLLIPKNLSLFQLLLQRRIAFLNPPASFWAFLSWLNKNEGVQIQKFGRILTFYLTRSCHFFKNLFSASDLLNSIY